MKIIFSYFEMISRVFAKSDWSNKSLLSCFQLKLRKYLEKFFLLLLKLHNFDSSKILIFSGKKLEKKLPTRSQKKICAFSSIFFFLTNCEFVRQTQINLLTYLLTNQIIFFCIKLLSYIKFLSQRISSSLINSKG